MKIVFSGGHHTSALPVAKALSQKGHQIYWFGHQMTMIKTPAPSVEYAEVTGAGIPFFNLGAGKPVSYDPWWWAKSGRAFGQALVRLVPLRPELIVAWGGYLAVPVALAGWILGVPLILHEQTRTSSRANRFLARFARKILVAWPDISYTYPKQKTVVVGLPLRPEIWQSQPGIFKFSQKRPTLLILGGKQGSRSINEAVFANLTKILARANLIHQCGAAGNFADLKRAKLEKKKLPGSIQTRYRPTAYLSDQEIGSAYRVSDLVISRAGVHLIQELLVLNKPAILVPLMIVPGQEQVKNAQLLKNLGLAETLPQNQLKLHLTELIESMLDRLEIYRLKPGMAQKLIIPDARDRITAEIQMINPKSKIKNSKIQKTNS